MVVVGAGIVGAACARELALAGAEVIVVDRGGVAAATTAHGEGNILVSDKGPGAELRLAQLSRRLWAEILGTETARHGGTVEHQETPGDERAAGHAETDEHGEAAGDGGTGEHRETGGHGESRGRSPAKQTRERAERAERAATGEHGERAETGGYAGRAEWEPKGGIVVATTEDGARNLREFAEGQRGAGVTAEELDADALAAAEPHLTREVTAAVHYPEDAQVQPAGAAGFLLAAARRAGARTRTGCEVLGAVTRGGRLTGVRTATGVLEADVFVNAAGPWAGELGRRLGAPVGVRPRRGEILVTAPMPPTVFHKVYDADYVGAIESDAAELRTSAVVEATRAGTILLGSSRRRIGFDDRLRPEVLSAIAVRALRLFPCLARVPVMRAYGGFRPYVDDHLPIIGADPRLAGLWHATGHEGAGIGLATGTARLLADLVAGRTPEIDAGPFRAGRPAVLDGAS